MPWLGLKSKALAQTSSAPLWLALYKYQESKYQVDLQKRVEVYAFFSSLSLPANEPHSVLGMCRLSYLRHSADAFAELNISRTTKKQKKNLELILEMLLDNVVTNWHEHTHTHTQPQRIYIAIMEWIHVEQINIDICAPTSTVTSLMAKRKYNQFRVRFVRWPANDTHVERTKTFWLCTANRRCGDNAIFTLIQRDSWPNRKCELKLIQNAV